MPAKDLGTKHTCWKCGTKYYDLKKPTPICPKCGADQRESPALKAPPPAERRSRPPARAAVEESAEVAEPEVEEEGDEVAEEEPEADEGEEP
jgi:uncharacterized protein (TIGR02300 family)